MGVVWKAARWIPNGVRLWSCDRIVEVVAVVVKARRWKACHSSVGRSAEAILTGWLPMASERTGHDVVSFRAQGGW